MNTIFNLSTLSTDFTSDFNSLLNSLNVNQYTPQKNGLLIQDFISVHDLHNKVTLENKLIKSTGKIKQVKRYFANEFNGYNIDNYLPIIKNKKTNTYTFYTFESLEILKTRLQNAIIVKAYILESIGEFNEQTFIVESLKLYNRISHKFKDISVAQFIEYVRFAASNHDLSIVENLADFKNRTYVKKQKYEWSKDDFNTLVDGLTLEKNYEMWLKLEFESIKQNNPDIDFKMSFRTFQRLLKKVGIKKNYAKRETKQNSEVKATPEPETGFVSDLELPEFDTVQFNVSTKGRIFKNIKSIDINDTNEYDFMNIMNDGRIFNYR